MARKPNYRFERMERDRLKAEKRAERQKSKQEKPAGEPETTESSTVDPDQSPSENA